MRQVSCPVRRGAGRKGRKDLARSLPSCKVLAACRRELFDRRLRLHKLHRSSSPLTAQLRITATMSRMTWRSSMQSERIVVLRRALSQKTGMFLRVPPSGDAGTCCLGLCEKRPCDGQSPSSVYQSYPGSLTSTTLFGGESPIVCGGYGIVSPWSRLRAAERKPGDHVGHEGTCAQAQGDSLWLR